MAYLIGEPYKQRIDRALSVVEGAPLHGGVSKIETRFETLQQPVSSYPLHLAAYPRDVAWKKGSTAEVTLYTQSGSSYGPAMETLSDGSKAPRTVSVTNVANDFGVPNFYGTSEDVGPTPTMTWCVVGKPKGGDQYIAVEGPQLPVQLANVYTDKIGNEWPIGEARTVEITATGNTVEVYSVLDSYTKLDFQNGLVFAKSVDPEDPTKTANVVISPPATPLHEARFSEGNIDEEWPRGDTKQLLVTRADGEEVQVPVENTFFDTFKPGTAALAIGRFGTTFSVIAGPQGAGEVTPGTLVSPIAPNEQWDAGSIRPVRITGMTTEVDVVNVFEELTPLDGHRGVLFAKSEKDPLGGEGTANVLIAPAPKELFEARFSQGNIDDEWVRGQTKELIVPSGAGRQQDILVPVTNKFFDPFKPGTAALAIGKIDGEFCVLTNNNSSSDVLLANRTDQSEWPRGSERGVRVHGETRTISAVNLVGDYESWDARDQPQGPNLLAVRGSGLGASGGTQWYVVAPPPKSFDLGTWDGEWQSGSERQFYLNSNGQSVQASNTLFDLPSGGSGAVAKIDGEWKLVSVQLETAEATIVENVQERVYATAGNLVTVVTDVEVSGKIKQSAASPVTIQVTPVSQAYAIVTGVNVGAELIQSSNADPILVSLTATTSNISLLDSVSVTATLDSNSCSIVAGVTPTRRDISVVTSVSGQAELDLSKLDLNVSTTVTTSQISVVNDVLVEYDFDVEKLYVEIDTTVHTTQVRSVGGTAIGKFVESTQTATILRFPGTVQ